jgi:hypothetical protein
MILGRSNNVNRKTKYIMLQNTPTKGEIRQQVKFNDRLFLKNQAAGGFKDFMKKIGKGAKKAWKKVRTPIKKIWDSASKGGVNKLLRAVPLVGDVLAEAIDVVDDVIDTGVAIGKDVKKNAKQVKKNLTDTNQNTELLDNVDLNSMKQNYDKLKQDYDWVKNKTMDVYSKIKDKLSAKQQEKAEEAAGMLNLEILKDMKPMQRGRMKKILPYAPYIDINKHGRVTIPKVIRDNDAEAPKTIDNTGGRLFLKGYASGINLKESSGRINLSGNLTLAEPQSGACSTTYVKSEPKKSGQMSKEEIYKKLFG